METKKKSKLKDFLKLIDAGIKALVAGLLTIIGVALLVSAIALALNFIPATIAWAILVPALGYKLAYSTVYWWSLLLSPIYTKLTYNNTKKDK